MMPRVSASASAARRKEEGRLAADHRARGRGGRGWPDLPEPDGWRAWVNENSPEAVYARGNAEALLTMKEQGLLRYSGETLRSLPSG